MLLFPAQADAILRNKRRGTACGLMMKKKKVKTSIFSLSFSSRSCWHTILSHSPRRQKLRTNYAPSFPAPPALLFFPELLNWILVGGIRKMTEAMTPPFSFFRYRSHRIPPLRTKTQHPSVSHIPNCQLVLLQYVGIQSAVEKKSFYCKDNSNDLNRMQENKYEVFEERKRHNILLFSISCFPNRFGRKMEGGRCKQGFGKERGDVVYLSSSPPSAQTAPPSSTLLSGRQWDSEVCSVVAELTTTSQPTQRVQSHSFFSRALAAHKLFFIPPPYCSVKKPKKGKRVGVVGTKLDFFFAAAGGEEGRSHWLRHLEAIKRECSCFSLFFTPGAK